MQVAMTEALWTCDAVGVGPVPTPRLDQLTLRIEPGITAILGPSGAGKTTLCDLIVGFQRPDRGTVTGPPTAPAGERLGLYWSPTAGLWPHLSVAAHLATVAPARPRRPIAELLKAFALSHRAHATPTELSAGERERLSVARALASEAAVLVLDEPFAHVDGFAAASCWQVLMECVLAQRTSLVFSTHHPERVIGTADRVILLHDGRLLAQGPVDALYHRPESERIAACLGVSNWFTTEDEGRWFAGAPVAGCVRPERLHIHADSGGMAVVAAASFHGAHGYADLRCLADGVTRRFVHRPVQALDQGDRVLVAVHALPTAPVPPTSSLLLLMLIAIALCGGCTGEGKSLTFSAERSWNLPPVNATLPAARGLGRLGDDQVLVLDTAGRVLVYNGAGTLVRSWAMPASDIGRPEGVVQLRDGRIAVADTHYHRVVLFDATGAVVRLFGSEGDGGGQFRFPVGVAGDPAGNLYVSEYGGNDRVQKFSPTLALLCTFGSFGTELGKFQRPQGLAWHDGRIYVADALNNRIQVFRDDGPFIGVLGGEHPPELLLPYNVAIGADGALTVVEYSGDRVTRLDMSGAVIGRYGASGTGDRQFSTPWGMTMDGHGRVWVADTGNRRLVELSP
jgi:ABC-type multidrug transport system ATPase subunit/sugar lactone lactonase YvrE